jgi:Asp-tRNA(Asn)/Glu-tRNA(Gln) amidotransferase A subunit family amidase
MILTELGATAAVAAIGRGDLSSEELVRACLDRIAALEPRVRAFVDLQAEEALAHARILDRQRGSKRGALHGVPVAIKEIFDVRGMRCSWGTPLHKTRIPRHDATAVARLRAAGAVILGTTVSTEYAIAAPGPTTNPHDASRTPGGSSSGSAAAVAANMVPLALGSQTIGSIVRPATYCGVYGLKPTHGAIAMTGAMPLSGFLDHVGVLARTPEDIALVCNVLFERNADASGAITVDPGSLDKWTAPPHVLLIEGPLSWRIEAPTRTALERARIALESRGARVAPRELPATFGQAMAWLEIILCRDIAVNHGGDGDRAGDQFSQRLRDLLARGRAITDAQYAEAIDHARRYRQTLLELLEGDAIICAPVTDGIAPVLAQGTGAPDLQGLYSLTGLPTLAVPLGLVDGLPVGVQLVAAPGREGYLLDCAQAMRFGV